MIVETGNVRAKIVDATDEERARLEGYLSYESKSYAGGEWRTERRSFVTPTGTFPAGFVPLLQAKGFFAEVRRGEETETAFWDEAACGRWTGELREHQLDGFLRAMSRPRGIFRHPTACLSADTLIGVARRDGRGRSWSYKLSIEELFRRENGLNKISAGKRKNSSPTLVRFRSEDGAVRLGEVAGVVYSGRRETFVVGVEDGRTIRATKDHRFLAEDGWRRLHDLRVGDRVFVERTNRKAETKKERSFYDQISRLVGHPHAGRRGVKDPSSRFSVPAHRAVYEAFLNGLPLDEYVARLRADDVVGFRFLGSDVHVYHKDENKKNNALENLEVLSVEEHLRRHGRESGFRNVLPRTELATITSISANRVEDTYDVLMRDEPHNFVANGFVVHNSGKGTLLVALGICVPIRWIVLTHRSTILEELKRRFERYGVVAGEISSGVFSPERVTIAMVKTVRSLMAKKGHRAFFDSVEGVMLDEVHVAGGAEVRQVLERLPRASYRWGFSGTPLDRGDQKNLHIIGAFGPVIHKVEAKELVEKGVIAAARVRLVPVRVDPEAVAGAGDWRALYERAVAENPARLKVAVREILAARKPSFAFVTALAHGRALEDALLGAGVACEFVWGEKNSKQREATLERLRTGIVSVVVTNKVLQEGVDVVGLRSTVYAGGGKSVIAQLQSLGRGSRTTEGKSAFDVVDVWDLDCGCRGREHWGCRVLRKHAIARKETYEREGYEVSVGDGVAKSPSEP